MSATVAAPAVEAGSNIVVENAATGGVAGEVPDMTREIPSLVARARRAQTIAALAEQGIDRVLSG